MLEENIYHPGVVNRITDRAIEVAITPHTACSGCHAKSFCQVADQEQKVIEVPQPAFTVAPGEKVEVVMKASLGLRAVLIAYIFPVLLILGVMIAGIAGNWKEMYLALGAIGMVVLYFLLLYRLRNRLKKQFSFSIRKP